MAGGTLLILVGTKVLSVNPAKVHAPFWVLTVLGVVFLSPGLWMWDLARRQFSRGKQSRQAARLSPHERAFADYPWNPRGFESQRWAKAIKKLVGALFITLFLSAFNFWAFQKDAPGLLQAIVGLFDAFALFFWYVAVLAIGRAMKFGDSRIAFTSFPYRLDEPVVIHWQPPSGINLAKTGSFTLRVFRNGLKQAARQGSVTRTHAGGDLERHLAHPGATEFPTRLKVGSDIPDSPWLPEHCHECTSFDLLGIRSQARPARPELRRNLPRTDLRNRSPPAPA